MTVPGLSAPATGPNSTGDVTTGDSRNWLDLGLSREQFLDTTAKVGIPTAGLVQIGRALRGVFAALRRRRRGLRFRGMDCSYPGLGRSDRPTLHDYTTLLDQARNRYEMARGKGDWSQFG